MADTKDKVTISLDCAIGMVPMYTGGYDIFQFINKCEFLLGLVEPECVPILLKFITFQLDPKLYALIRFEDITKWEDIKIHLINELKTHLLKLEEELRIVKMRRYENVNTYYNRVEQLHYKIRNIMYMVKPESELKSLQQFYMSKTIAHFTIGLIEPIRMRMGEYSTLEETKRMAEIFEEGLNDNRNRNRNGNRN